MPALPNVADVCRVQFVQALGDDSNILNRLFFPFTGTLTDAICEAIALEAAGSWNSHLAAYIGNDFSLNAVNVLDLTSDTGAFYDAPVSHAGTFDAASEAAELSVIVKMAISRHYRGGHPRWYQSGIPIGNRATPQTWGSTYLGDFLTAWNLFVNELIGYEDGGVTLSPPVNISYYQGFTPVRYPSGRYRNVPNVRTEPIADTITAFTLNEIIGSQRRRSEQNR